MARTRRTHTHIYIFRKFRNGRSFRKGKSDCVNEKYEFDIGTYGDKYTSSTTRIRVFFSVLALLLRIRNVSSKHCLYINHCLTPILGCNNRARINIKLPIGRRVPSLLYSRCLCIGHSSANEARSIDRPRSQCCAPEKTRLDDHAKSEREVR